MVIYFQKHVACCSKIIFSYKGIKYENNQSSFPKFYAPKYYKDFLHEAICTDYLIRNNTIDKYSDT